MCSKVFHTSPKTLVVIVFFISVLSTFAQQATPFKVRYQGHVNGDMMLIANNIVNRSEGNEGTKSPYNENTNRGKLNDEFEMNYIDVDSDASTFSSSTADLVVENPSSKKLCMPVCIGRLLTCATAVN